MTDWSELNLLSPLWLLSNQFNWLITFRMKELRGCVRALKWDCYHKSNRKLIFFFSPFLFFSNSNPILSLSAYFFKSHSSPLEDFWHNKSVLLIFNPNLLRASRSYFCCCSWISVCFYDWLLCSKTGCCPWCWTSQGEQLGHINSFVQFCNSTLIHTRFLPLWHFLQQVGKCNYFFVSPLLCALWSYLYTSSVYPSNHTVSFHGVVFEFTVTLPWTL